MQLLGAHRYFSDFLCTCLRAFLSSSNLPFQHFVPADSHVDRPARLSVIFSAQNSGVCEKYQEFPWQRVGAVLIQKNLWSNLDTWYSSHLSPLVTGTEKREKLLVWPAWCCWVAILLFKRIFLSPIYLSIYLSVNHLGLSSNRYAVLSRLID
jgi:hypothetical protein